MTRGLCRDMDHYYKIKITLWWTVRSCTEMLICHRIQIICGAVSLTDLLLLFLWQTCNFILLICFVTVYNTSKITLLHYPRFFFFVKAGNYRVYNTSPGDICLGAELVLAFIHSAVRFSGLCWSSFPLTTISIPVCNLKCAATSDRKGKKKTKKTPRMINNLISPLITLVQSCKWITWEKCQDITNAPK